MTTTKRMRITIQTERVLVLNSGGSIYQPCAACGDEVRMVTIDQAANLSGANAREIYREAEAGKLHFMQSEEGSVLICLNSLTLESKTERMKGIKKNDGVQRRSPPYIDE